MNETTKKHFSTKVKSMILSMILLLAIAVQIEPVYAAKTATWSSSKIPGSDITNGTQRSLTYYTGDISFVATKLGGDCSYIAAKCKGTDIAIKNHADGVLVSVVNRPANFQITPTTDGRTTMSFDMRVVSNATKYQNVYGSGTIGY